MARKKKETASVQIDANSTEELINIIHDNINKLYKDKDISQFLEVDNQELADSIWIPTGCDVLDLAISNRIGGGIPCGRVTEIAGWEASGKTLVGLNVLANVQKMGGIAVMVDTEFSLDTRWAQAIGLDLKKLIYATPESIEEAWETIDAIITTIKQSKKGKKDKKPVAILFDTPAASPSKNELKGDYDKEGWNTDKAIVNSMAMRKLSSMISHENVALIINNQFRDKLGVTFGRNYQTSGGKAIGYHASVRIELKSVGRIKNKEDKIVGIQTEAFTFKNKVGPPFRTVAFNIIFDIGVDNYSSWLNISKEAQIVQTRGAWSYLYDPKTGEEHAYQGESSFVQLLEENKELRDRVYNAICEHMLMLYRTEKNEAITYTIQRDDDNTDDKKKVAPGDE